MQSLINWLADPARAGEVSAYGLLLGVVGTILTLAGVGLTYIQARRARLTADKVRSEVEQFQFRRSRYDVSSDIGEAKTAMESTARLLQADSWKNASLSYDDARKAVLRVQLACSDLPATQIKRLRGISDHLTAFSNNVDAAVAGKDEYPDKTNVLSAIRRNCDSLTAIQIEIQKAIK